MVEPKTGKNRVHLDLITESAEHYRETVERLLALGATRADIGQQDVGWEVLADVEGNEFCVLPPPPSGRGYEQTGLVYSVVADTADPLAAAGFWQQATGWERLREDADLVVLRSAAKVGPFLVLLKTPDQKTVKNRMHLDVAPEKDEDQAQAAQRLIDAGATRIDVGQGDSPWTVLAAPDGSEFCVLTPR